MRPAPARILFSLLAASAVVLGAVTGQTIFFLLLPLPLLLLATSLATSRVPLTRALGDFRNHEVDIRLWGAPPPDKPGAALVLTSVNLISAGVHVFFATSDGVTMHLKVAQPRDATLAPDNVIIRAARYVQWNGTDLTPTDTVAAVSIALAESSAMELTGVA
ncbi:MAG: hypothetical protein WA208_10400 [Thermoanaerobaculia bacterium]